MAPLVIGCVSCRQQVMARGDHTSWKAIQMKPTDDFLTWYCCETEFCCEAYAAAREVAAIAWGWNPDEVWEGEGDES